MFHNINNFLNNVGSALGGGHVMNPPVPYSAPILMGPFPGRTIQIQGHIPYHAQRFAINLQSGPGTNPPNINFHFNPRFDQNAIVKNNCKFGAWGAEERGHLPFQRGQHFDITIHIEHYQFRVTVNGQHYATFTHRNPYQEANFLEINGDVQLTSIRQW